MRGAQREWHIKLWKKGKGVLCSKGHHDFSGGGYWGKKRTVKVPQDLGEKLLGGWRGDGNLSTSGKIESE